MKSDLIITDPNAGTDKGVFAVKNTPIEGNKAGSRIREEERIKCPVCGSDDVEFVK